RTTSYDLHGDPQRDNDSPAARVNHERAKMDKARLTLLYNEFLSGKGDAFSLLCQLKTWVEAELLGLSQEMARNYTRLAIRRQRIAEMLSDPGPEPRPERAALAEALTHINDSIHSLEGAFAAAGIHIDTATDNNPVLSPSPSCGNLDCDPR